MKLFNTRQGWVVQQGNENWLLAGFSLDSWLRGNDPVGELQSQVGKNKVESLKELVAPITTQEVWAAGVTYERSKAARMEESDFAATAYDRVYAAPRPEIFFKATPSRCSGPGEAVTLRDDSKWMVPEPELTLVVSSGGKIVGYTIGNDMSCRDIEGDNTLYLPQAKIWDKCCALGPCIRIADGFNVREQTISLRISRGGKDVFTGSTPISRIVRKFEDIVGYLFRNQSFPTGVLLLTGTGIVPPDEFTLHKGDTITIGIEGIGELVNPVA